MASRTWKIGESAKGGVITAETTKTTVNIIGKDWDMEAGSTRGSSQTGAKEFTRLTVKVTDGDAERQLEDFIQDLTTSYYTDQIMEWIRSKVKFEPKYGWM